MKDNFCSAPWVAMFYHNNQSSVCCVNTHNEKSNPLSFVGSSFVKELKTKFISNERDDTCKFCYELDDSGDYSLRKYINSVYTLDAEQLTTEVSRPKYLELRGSNLCNFACRMCGPVNSNKFNKEVINNPNLQKYFALAPDDLTGNDANWSEIKEIVKDLDYLYLTGGEPMLIKEHYDILDYVIDNGYSDKMFLQITTNGSVYNPLLMERLKKFKKVRITLSIDGINEVAEYQRYGTIWNDVRENFYKFLSLPHIDIVVTSVVSAYTVLDYSQFADFLLEARSQSQKPFYWSLLRAITPTQMNFSNLNKDLSLRAIDQINSAITKLEKDFSYTGSIDLLKSYVKVLENNTYNNFDSFVEFTRDLDQARDQSFNKVFNYNLY